MSGYNGEFLPHEVADVKKLGAAVFLLVIVVVTVVVVLPETIDWNQYRNELAERAENLTGRKMTIGGDISIALFPAPALVANDVRVANVKGAATRDMINLSSLEIQVAPGPLLGGTVQVETIKLIDPVIELERLADGSVNWELAPLRREADGSASVALSGIDEDPQSEKDDGSVRLDRFLIDNGTVIFRDTQEGLVERIDRFHAHLAIGSLTGPFDSGGKLRFRGVPLGYEASVGRVIEGRTVPLNMILTAQQGVAKAEISGAVVDLGASPRFKGKIVVGSDGLGGLIDNMFGAGTTPAFMAEPIRIETETIVSVDDIAMTDMEVSLGRVRAAGDAKITFSRPVNIDARLAVNRIDLDALMAEPTAPKAADEDSKGQKPDAEKGKEAAKPAPVPTSAQGFSIPQNVTGMFELSADAITYNGSKISDARINAELDGGAILVHQVSALMPGGSDVFANGLVTATDGAPVFDGNLDAKVSNLRRFMSWLGIDPPDIASDRLRNAAFKGRIVVNAREIRGRELDVTLDTSRITGAITVAKRRKPAFGARFNIDRLNLDAYLKPGPNGKNGGGGKAKDRGGDPLAFLGVLNRFDANLQLGIDRLTYLGVPFNEVALKGTVFGGNVEIREASVGDVVGATGRVSGSIVDLNKIPGLKGVHFELEGVDMVRLLRQLQVDVPFASRDIGVAELTGRADGVLLRPEFDLILKTTDASAGLKGRLSVLPIEPLFDGEIRVRHSDFPRFLRLLGIVYRPAGRLGGFGLSAKAKGDFSKITFDGLSGRIGPVQVNGSLLADLTGNLPRLVGAIKTGRIVVDEFLPASRSASLGPALRAAIVPVAFKPAATGGDDEKDRWPTDKIDLSALQAFDAEMKLAFEALVYSGVELVNSALDATLVNGTLCANSLTGRLFGGQLKGIATVYSAPGPRINGSISLSGADFAKAEQTYRGESLASGNMNFRMTFDAKGRSVAHMVAGMNGEGSAELMKIRVAPRSEGTAAGPVVGFVSGLNDLVGLAGGKTGGGLADFSGSFKMVRGVARTNDIQFISSAGEGRASGLADLVKWRTKLQGDIRLSKNVFSKLLSGTTGLEVVLPFRIEGKLDEPDVVIDTGKLPGKALTIPGALLRRSGDILQRILPGPR